MNSTIVFKLFVFTIFWQ